MNTTASKKGALTSTYFRSGKGQPKKGIIDVRLPRKLVDDPDDKMACLFQMKLHENYFGCRELWMEK